MISRFVLLNCVSSPNVDECVTGAHQCHKDAICTNTAGSYKCQCKDSKHGNGFICNEPAAFKGSPSTRRVKMSETVTLSCSYYNSSSVFFEWIKDYEAIDTRSYQTSEEISRSSGNTDITTRHLTFNISSAKEQGRYWCQLKQGLIRKESGKATVILTDSSATEVPMIINEPYSPLMNSSTSNEYKALNRKITAAINSFMGAKSSNRSRLRRSTSLSDAIVVLKDIRSDPSGNIRLNAVVYYESVTNEKRLAICIAMRNMTSNSLPNNEITITVQVTKTYDCCYSSSTGDPDIKGVIEWPTQIVGEQSIIGCPKTETNENATRQCASNDFEREPSWGTPDASKCMYIREATQKLDQLTKVEVNASSAITVVKQLEAVTSNQTNIKTFVDVALAVDVIVNVAAAQSNNAQAFDGIVNVTNSLMSADTDVVASAQEKSNASKKLVQAIEKFAENIPLPADKTTQTFSKKNLAIGVTQVTEKEQKDLETNGFIISGNVDGEKTSVEMEKLSDAKGSSFSRVADIKLPGELFKVASKKKGMTKGGLRVTTLLYDNAKLFRSKETSGSSPSKKINSKILAVGIKGIKLKNLTEQERVRSEFKQLNMSEEGKPICVYWEEIQREWSSRGCRYDGENAKDAAYRKCSCNHLTNFALLLDVTQKPTTNPTSVKDMLKYFTYIGCGLSIAGLTITLFTIACSKNLRKKVPQKILIGVCFSLIFALIAFLVGTQHTSRFYEEKGTLKPFYPVVCLVSSVATHYFVLCSFLWMSMQSYYLYLSCVKVMGIHQANIMGKMTAFALGVPLIAVAIVVGVHGKDLKTYTEQEKLHVNQTAKILMEDNGYVDIIDERNRVCMINGISFYAAYLGPIGIIILVNFIFMILSIRGIFGSAQKTKSREMGKRRKARIIFSCVTIMGLAWIIGVFAIGPLKVALQIVFTVFNSLQGVFIFVFYCLLNKNVQEEWRRCFCSGRIEETTSSQSTKRSTMKGKPESYKRRISSSKSARYSITSQSQSEMSAYNSSLLALRREFENESYSMEGVFTKFHDRDTKYSYVGPAAETEADRRRSSKLEGDPHLSTAL